MVNEERGEGSITLEDVEYGLRPSFGAIQQIEKLTGRSVLQLALAATALDLSTEDLGRIAGAFMRAWGAGNPDAPNARVAQSVSDQRVAELIFEEGATKVAPTLGWLLRAALTGGVTASGELRAAWLEKNRRPSDAAA